MKCCWRSVLGVVIGVLNILICIVFSIIMIGYLTEDAFNPNPNTSSASDKEIVAATKTTVVSTGLSAFLLMTLLSILLIVGIIKRRHQLMWPWLIISAFGVALWGIRLFVAMIVGFASGTSIGTIFGIFLISALAVCIQGLIVWPIYTLYREIVQENNPKSEDDVAGIPYNNIIP